jgi:predicted protein tyrosine phosphatase
MVMGTYILDKHKVVSFKLNPDDYNVLIRITNPKDNFSRLQYEHIYNDVLGLKFYDLDDETSDLYLFNQHHLEKLLDFFKKHTHYANMVIHCDEGRSRSAGVAAGWFLFKDIKSSIYKLYHDNIHFPNRRIVGFFFSYYNEPIRRIDKWEKDLYG